MTDFAARRTVMVDTQVRPSDVTKFPIIEAMLSVPREIYVPEAKREAAYAGENVSLGGGRVVFDPRTLAKLLDALDIQPGERVMVVASGLGYSAAVIAAIGAAVVAVESDAALAEGAKAALAGVATVLAGPLAAGAAAQGPYDVILVEGGVEELPEALATQLKEGGRIGAVFMEAALGSCRIGHKIDGTISWRFAFNASAPVLPGFHKARAFVL